MKKFSKIIVAACVLICALLILKIPRIRGGLKPEMEKASTGMQNDWETRGRRKVSKTLGSPFSVQVFPTFDEPVDIQMERLLWDNGWEFFVYSYYLKSIPSEAQIRALQSSFHANGFVPWAFIPLEQGIDVPYDAWETLDQGVFRTPDAAELFDAAGFKDKDRGYTLKQRHFFFEDKEKQHVFMTGLNCLVPDDMPENAWCKVELTIRSWFSPEQDYETRKRINDANMQMPVHGD